MSLGNKIKENYSRTKHLFDELAGGFKIANKLGLDMKLKNFYELGIQNNNFEHPVIISLTSTLGNIKDLHYVIYSLLTQTMKPDKVVLWLSEDEFPDKKAPAFVSNLQSNGLIINWCKEMLPYQKLLPSLKEYPHALIIAVDDDIFYPADMVEKLYNAHKKDPSVIQANKIRRAYFYDTGELAPYNVLNYPFNVLLSEYSDSSSKYD